MLAVFGIGNEVFAAVHVCPVCKATEAVGIGYGIEQDDGVGEQVVYGGTLRRCEIICNQWRGVASAGFIAVDAISHVHNYGHCVDVERGRLVRVCELPMLCLDGGEILVVLRRCDGEQQEGPLLICLGILCEGYAVGAFGQCVHVVHDEVVPQVPIANLKSEKGFGCGDVGVVDRTLGQVIAEVNASMSRCVQSDQCDEDD